MRLPGSLLSIAHGLALAPAIGLACLTQLPPFAAAQEQATGGLSIELNRADQVEGACRLTFMAENGQEADLEALALETVLIDAEGRVDRLTLFEFGALPAGLPRVRQFDVPGLSCDSLARVLVNGVSDCAPGAACEGGIAYSSRTEVEVIG